MNIPSSLLPILVVILALSACGEKNAKTDAPSETVPSKAGDRPATAPPDHPSPTPQPDHPDPSALFAELTADNALQIRTRLRADASRWKSVAGPFYRKWAGLDPAAAMAAAREEDSKFRLIASTMALAGWTAMDPYAARDWFDANMAEPHELAVAQAMVDQWPVHDLANLAAWTGKFPEGAGTAGLVTRLAGTWRRSAPVDAARWLAGLPAGTTRDRATDFVFQTWGREDPAAAGDYLVANMNNPNNDAAISAYAKAVVPDDAEAATLWAQEIASVELRDQILKIIPLIRSHPSGGPEHFTGP